MTPAPGLAGDATVPAGATAERELPDVPWVVLASGGERAPHAPVRSRRVLLEVGVAAAVVIVVVALVGGVATRRLAEREAVNDAGRRADLIAEAVLQPVLSDGLITSDPQALRAVDQVVRRQVLGRFVVRVKIWSSTGRIVYSDESRLIGQTFSLGDHERDAIASRTTNARVSDMDEPENRYERGQGRFLEVYRPVWTSPGNATLLFETYAPYDEVTHRSTQLWRGFFGLLVTTLVLLLVLLMPLLWRLLDGVHKAQAQRESLLQRSVDASHAERRRVAGTLHDGVVQELAATSFALAGCTERAEREGSTQLASELRDCAALVRTSIGGLRSLLVDIYPPSLESAGLTAILADLVGPLRSRDVTVRLELPADATPVDPAIERVAYRIAHECLANVAKHAAASSLLVRLERDSERLRLDVVDDGVGFDVAALLSTAPQGHLGLHVMTDLANQAGATLALASAPGRGTRWRLTIPAW